MRRFISIILAAILIFSFVMPVGASDITDESDALPFEFQLDGDANFAKDSVLVKLKNSAALSVFSDSGPDDSDLGLDLGVGYTDMRLLNPSADVSEIGVFAATEKSSAAGRDQNNLYALELEETGVGAVEKALAILNANPAVEYAEPNYIREVTRTPNDPYFTNNSLWGLARINAPQAWDIATGSKDVVVGIVDSGIDGSHPDLAPNLWENPEPNTGGYTNDRYGYDFYNNKGATTLAEVTDPDNHGTHVAGTVGAKGNNSQGVVGVNWDVSLAWLRHTNDKGHTLESATIEAINYATNHEIPILVNSYGSHDYSKSLEDAVRGYPGLFVAAAGNSGVNTDNRPFYPACYDSPNIISVAATDEANKLSKYEKGSASSWGAKSVHIAAPGSNIWSTSRGNNFRQNGGTSMAAPHVAGVAALMLSVDSTLTTAQLRKTILNNVQPIPALNGYVSSGGILDAYEAVLSAKLKPDPEKINAFVTRLYTEALGKNPADDEAGFTDLVNGLASGSVTGANIAFSFFLSPEMENRYAAEESAHDAKAAQSWFVDKLYVALLDREPDAKGKAGWLTIFEDLPLLGTKMPSEAWLIVQRFVMTDEYLRQCNALGVRVGDVAPQGQYGVPAFVDSLYQVFLGRRAEPSGLNSWSNALLNGTNTGTKTVESIIFEQRYREYLDRIYAKYPTERDPEHGVSKANRQYVLDLYLGLYSRVPGGNEQVYVNHFAKIIDDATARASPANRQQAKERAMQSVLRAFTSSQEFADLCAKYNVRQ